jgi:hypothetical protein
MLLSYGCRPIDRINKKLEPLRAYGLEREGEKTELWVRGASSHVNTGWVIKSSNDTVLIT